MAPSMPWAITPCLIGLLFIQSCGESRIKDKDAALFEKAKISYAHRDFQRAKQDFSSVISSSKNYYPAYVMLGKSFYYAGESDKAIGIFKTLLSHEPGSVGALNWLARIEGIDKGNREQGLKYCDKALSLDPENTTARFYKAMLLEDMNRFKDAIMEYSQALESSHIIRLAHYKLALLFEGRGVHDRAVDEFKQALKYEASDELAKDIKKHLQSH